jgi:hypothetical protein
MAAAAKTNARPADNFIIAINHIKQNVTIKVTRQLDSLTR